MVRNRGHPRRPQEGKTAQEKVRTPRVENGIAKGLSKLTHLLLQRVKQLKEEPYSQKEAEAAVGLRTDNGKPEKAQNEDVAMA